MPAQTQTQTQAPWTNDKKADISPELGIDTKSREDVVGQLEQVLADTYTLYLKTQNAHWNVTGPMFKPLHDLFEEQYQELAAATDRIAERIRALGQVTPATFKEFSRRTDIQEWDSPPEANQMVADLVRDQETVIHTLRELAERTDKAGDEGTLNMVGDRLEAHEQHAWMLRVHLE